MALFPQVDSVELGGSLTVRGPIIMLAADMSGNNKISTFRNVSATPGTTTGYTPSGSNKFYATGFLVQVQAGGGGPDVRLGYADTDAGWVSGTLPTNPVGVGFGAISAQGDSANMFCFSPDAAGSTGEFTYRQQTPLRIAFPNGKYPFVIWNNNLSPQSGILLFGYEAP